MSTAPQTQKSSNTAVRPTTLIQSPRLNSRCGLDITLASETFQVTGSFKFRAAYNLASKVSQTHIITASSGNFGQALAYACKLLDKRCTVVMPDNSAAVKVAAVKEFGGEVDMVVTAQKSRAQRVAELAAQYPQAYVASAYDDALVIEGNRSLGAELAKIAPKFDAIFVPIGGGGLSGGIITGLRENGCDTPVYGVEPELANDCARSIAAGTLIVNESEPQTIADGVRTVSVGLLNWEILKNGLAKVVETSEEEIKQAMGMLFHLANVKSEPTGAVALSGAIKMAPELKGRRVCCIVSGGNVDPAVFHELVCNTPSV
jgi:threonine dehydratase